MRHHNSPDGPRANDTVVHAVDAGAVTTSPRDGGWTWRKKTAQGLVELVVSGDGEAVEMVVKHCGCSDERVSWGSVKPGGVRVRGTTSYEPATFPSLGKRKAHTEFNFHGLQMHTQSIGRNLTPWFMGGCTCNDVAAGVQVPNTMNAPIFVYHQLDNFYQNHHRAVIDDGTGITTITCFSPEAHTFAPNCNEVVSGADNKNTHHIPTALKQLENTACIFQYHFGKGARPEDLDFTLDAAFKPSPQPLGRKDICFFRKGEPNIRFPNISLISVSGPKWDPYRIKVREKDLLTFIRTANPTKVRIGERQRGDDEPKLLDTTVGRVVPFLPVTPAHGVGIQPVSRAVETYIGGVVPRRQEKRKSMIIDSDEPSHLAKKLRKDHRIPVGIFVAGKSMPAIQRLLARAVQNDAVRGEPDPSLPFVTSFVSTMPEREDERHTDALVGANLQTITAPQRIVISSDSSYHSGTHIAETEVDSLIRSSAPAMTTVTTVTVTAGAATVVKEAVVKPSLFATGSSSVGGTESILVGFSDLTGNDFLVGDIRTVIDPDSDLQKVYVSRWNVTNGSSLDNNRDCHEMVDEFATQIIKEIRRLKSIVDDQAEVLKVKEEEVKDLKAQLLLKEVEAAKAIRLRVEVSKFETAEKSLQDEIRSVKERNAALEKEKGELGVRVVDLSTSVNVREQEAAALDAVVTTVKLQNDRLID
ncbi:hypothetical protein Tco_1563096, partial [Tanacetum coccineum]